MVMKDLTERERELLDVAADVFYSSSDRAQSIIFDRTGLSSGRFYTDLNVLIDTERALAAEPVLVRRLLDRRDRRRAA